MIRARNLLFSAILFSAAVCRGAEAPSIPQRDLPGFGSLGNLGLLSPSSFSLSLGGWWTPRDQSAELVQNRLTIQIPVSKTDKDSFSLSLGGSALHSGSEQTLSSGTPVPVDLWKAELGTIYARKMDEDRNWGVRTSVGSASDHPFSTWDVTTLSVVGSYSWPESRTSRWTLLLAYSNNSPIANGVPIPGFSYSFREKNLFATLGLPFSALVWMPAPGCMFSFSFFGPTINSELAFGNPRGIQLFTGWSWTQSIYLRESRPDPLDRLYYLEMHSPIGLRAPLYKNLKTEFSIGYSFDRRFFEGTHLNQATRGSTDLAASGYGAWNLKWDL